MTTSTQPQSPALLRLAHVERKIVQAVEFAGSVMEELANAGGPRMEFATTQCHEFMKSMKDIQTVLHEEIKSMCEYRPYENCDYIPRMGGEISLKKIDCVLDELQKLEDTINNYQSSGPS
ncbi:hypothetical protein SELMODRAFT_126111 [Selaginella moellendorffii]|uniref:Mediator of RNA polymerase II transcription subunit 11 n=1 Tax=Selaginella moellendorffii TaxID=88036 RepID=D8SVN5_SELML|nr:mediator of RNA polymerase II transcription subunit 11 [Selaginella moellendorffii]XP_024517026.1 mediator of RNA polymerase II transcription subunit 11 [Selaginella moellendorffii]XP_024517027.1 mediator of RNA polymerase II transcription subunit 11 [Selaginella moellendorffii]EFJ11468.1 hypothetical protein SELMODRAFT_126111 [Selaginella moellendorffii]|eukprot:XP_002987381.1 mediator of RNA polymerase II transcription subunit 11 [Selaginella moellendorffii]